MSSDQMMSREELSNAIALRAWKDEDFRARIMSNPNAVYEKETNQKLPPGAQIKVVEDTHDTVHFVIPFKSDMQEQLSDEELEAVAGGVIQIANLPKMPPAIVCGKPIVKGKW